MSRGTVVLSLNRRDALPDDHPVQAQTGGRLDWGVEFGLEVTDIEAM